MYIARACDTYHINYFLSLPGFTEKVVCGPSTPSWILWLLQENNPSSIADPELNICEEPRVRQPLCLITFSE